MVRFLIFLVGMLTTNRPGGMRTAPLRRGDSYGRAEPPEPEPDGRDDGDTWFLPPAAATPPQRPYREAGRAPVQLERGYVRTSPAAADPAQGHVGRGPGPGRPDVP